MSFNRYNQLFEIMENKIKWMKYAFSEAEKAHGNDEVPIGSVIIKDEKIIGRGYNQVESLIDCTAHSEVIAITSASNYLNNWRLNGCSLYVTKEPCVMCYGAIVNARITNLYFGVSDKEKGFRTVVNENKLFYSKHLKLVESGIMKNECKGIIKDFFIKKRKNSNNSSE